MNQKFFRRIAGAAAGGLCIILSAPLHVYAQEGADEPSATLGIIAVLLALVVGMMVSIWQQNKKRK